MDTALRCPFAALTSKCGSVQKQGRQIAKSQCGGQVMSVHSEDLVGLEQWVNFKLI